MAKAKVTLPKDGLQTTIQSGEHIYHADEPLNAGGTNTGPSPTEMAMGALGSCIAMTMRLYAQRKGWELDGVELELDFERLKGKDYEAYDGDARYVHEITKSVTLHGDSLSSEQRERIIEIGGMCPVHRLIASPAFFVEQIIEQEG